MAWSLYSCQAVYGLKVLLRLGLSTRWRFGLAIRDFRGIDALYTE